MGCKLNFRIKSIELKKQGLQTNILQFFFFLKSLTKFKSLLKSPTEHISNLKSQITIANNEKPDDRL